MSMREAYMLLPILWGAEDPGTFVPAYSSKIWLFWTSTRAGTTNLFWETFCPDFAAR